MLSLFLLLLDEESDKNKFEYIYKKYVNDMYKWALKNTKNESEAKEIISDAFLSILEKIKILKTDNDVALKAYIFKVVKNKFYDKKNEENNQVLSLENLNNIADGSDLAKDLEELEQKEIILKIISEMTDIYRYVLYFKYSENYSIRSIAKMFDLSEGTVRKFLKEGVQHIIITLHKVEKNGI